MPFSFDKSLDMSSIAFAITKDLELRIGTGTSLSSIDKPARARVLVPKGLAEYVSVFSRIAGTLTEFDCINPDLARNNGKLG